MLARGLIPDTAQAHFLPKFLRTAAMLSKSSV
jgi:hypothetical protein